MDKEEKLRQVLKDLDAQKAAAIEYYSKDRPPVEDEVAEAEVERAIKERADDRADLAYYRKEEKRRQKEKGDENDDSGRAGETTGSIE